MRAHLLLASLVLLVSACDDTTTAEDAGSMDAGSVDAGSTDAGSTDAGSTDAGSTDAGSTDGGTSMDAGRADAGPRDAGTVDAGTDAGVCEDSPCRLLSPQCGCPSGEQCTLGDDAMPHCAPDGTAVEGESCADSDCAAGFVCAGRPGLPTCLRFCEDDGDCLSGSGSQCLYDFGGPKACSVGCDPVDDTGCPPGGGCTVLRDGPAGPGFIDCRPAGDGVAGDPCASEQDCVGGHLCSAPAGGGERHCRKWCTDDGDCPGDQGCRPFAGLQIGPNAFGSCG